MNLKKKWKHRILGIFLLQAGLVLPAFAAFPTQPITIVIPFASGGTSGTVASALSDRLAATLKQSVIVEHVAGASGSIGATRVKNAAPNGHTLLLAPLGVYVTNALVRQDIAYDPLNDFDLLTVAVRMPNVLAVHPSVPANNVAEFVAYMKSQSDKVPFATMGESSAGRLTTQLFWEATGADGQWVHHKGAGPAVQDVVAGKSLAVFLNASTALHAISAGKLKTLAVTSDRRWPTLPEVPTMREGGVNNLETYTWQAFAAPKGLPPAVKRTLHKALVNALHTPAIRQSLTEEGFEVIGGTIQEFKQFLDAETVHWRDRLRDARIKTYP